MKLSEKIRDLQDDARFGELTYDAINDGFNRCIEEAEFFEENQVNWEEFAKDFGIFVWGKVPPTDLNEFGDFVKRFVEEYKYNK